MNNQADTQINIPETLTENQTDTTLVCDDKQTQNLPEEKLFTQSELENLISERLKRERKTQSALLPVKEMLSVLCEKGIIKNGSYPEMATQLCGHLDTLLSGAKEENISVGTQNLPMEKEPETVQENCDALSFTPSDIAVIYEKHPASDIVATISSPVFLKFAQNRQGSFEQIYSDFLSLKNLFEEKAQSDSNSLHSSLASTSFSADSKSSFSTEHTNLTARQMQMAKNAGLSYREYSDLLNSIPKGTKSI